MYCYKWSWLTVAEQSIVDVYLVHDCSTEAESIQQHVDNLAYVHVGEHVRHQQQRLVVLQRFITKA